MEFKEFKAIYDDLELFSLKYPNISAYEYFGGFNDNPFRQISLYLKENNVPYTDLIWSSTGAYNYLAIEKKGYGTAEDFREKQWNYYRQIYNKSFSEVEYLKKKYLQSLNDRQYEEYFIYGLILIDSMFATDAGKQGFEKIQNILLKLY